MFGLLPVFANGEIAQAVNPADVKTEMVYGAGPSTQIVTLFFDRFSRRADAAGTKFKVPARSTKHAGGIRASGRYLFGRTGRPLSDAEKSLHKEEIPLGMVAVGFATGPKVDLPPLNKTDIERIFSGSVSNWSELGGPDAPVVLVGRERTEAVLQVLSESFPNLAVADYRQILKRDHAVVNYLNSPAGSYGIAYGALSNFAGLNKIEIPDSSFGVRVGLVFDRKNREHPLVSAVRKFARSDEWREAVLEAGYLPILPGNSFAAGN